MKDNSLIYLLGLSTLGVGVYFVWSNYLSGGRQQQPVLLGAPQIVPVDGNDDDFRLISGTSNLDQTIPRPPGDVGSGIGTSGKVLAAYSRRGNFYPYNMRMLLT